jgi:hypothetical protein
MKLASPSGSAVRAMAVANLCANRRCELAKHQRQNAYQQRVPGCVPSQDCALRLRDDRA